MYCIIITCMPHTCTQGHRENHFDQEHVFIESPEYAILLDALTTTNVATCDRIF